MLRQLDDRFVAWVDDRSRQVATIVAVASTLAALVLGVQLLTPLPTVIVAIAAVYLMMVPLLAAVLLAGREPAWRLLLLVFAAPLWLLLYVLRRARVPR